MLVTCDDARVKDRLQSWLDASRLAPPSTITLDVHVVDAVPEPPPVPIILRLPTVDVRVSPPPLGLHLSWTCAPAAATIASDSLCASILLTETAFSQFQDCVRTLLLDVLIFLLRRTGWHHIHAAAATDPSDRGWLIVGDTHCGKSTTVALLGSLGWSVTTDDIAFLTRVGDRTSVVGYRAPIALRDDVCRRVAPNGGRRLERRAKVGYWPEELGTQWRPTVDPEFLLFTSVGGSRTRTEAIGPAQALATLVRCSPWVIAEPEHADAHLDLITRLARQTRRYRVIVGEDLFAEPRRLEELVQ